jgi:signal transduction histidine kinase
VTAAQLALLGASLVAAIAYAIASRRFAPANVLRVSLVTDTFLIALMAATLEREELIALGYFWPMAFAAFLLGPRDTIFFTAMGALATILVPALAGVESGALTVTAEVIVLGLVGVVLYLLSRSEQQAEETLALERSHDAVALRIAERTRSSLDVETIMLQTAEELGHACNAARALIWPVHPVARAYEWTRPGVQPVDPDATHVPVGRVIGARVPVVVDEPKRGDAELQRYLREVGAMSLVGYPVAWQGQVVAVLGLYDDVPRNWERDAVPLLGQIASLVGAALAQAELFARQLETVEQMQELVQLREQFVANVSHELRTPLTSTIGFLRTLEREDLPVNEDDRRRFLRIARTEAERLGRLVEDLLEFARVGRGVPRLNLAPVAVGDVARQAAQRLTPENGREVAVDVADDVVAMADRDRLLQVVSNLLANALVHGAGQVTVRGFDDDQRVVLEVTDEGDGVSEERAAELFMPFARASEGVPGTGLGLAIARALAEAHGGSLTYRPAENGSPHAFVVTLPREPDVAHSA